MSEIDGGETDHNVMNIQGHDGDMVREAVNRSEYVEQKALGEVDGYEVLVVARVTEEGLTSGFRPKLTVHIGGRYEDGTYLGGSTVHDTFEELWDLDGAFGELYREHDLEFVEGGEDD